MHVVFLKRISLKGDHRFYPLVHASIFAAGTCAKPHLFTRVLFLLLQSVHCWGRHGSLQMVILTWTVIAFLGLL